MTDEQFSAWLVSPSAIRVVLIEAKASVSNSETTIYLATAPYVTRASDTPANVQYLPIVSDGIAFTERIALNGEGGLSYGDVEVSNVSGALDGALDYVWVNRELKAYLGDPRWPRADFRMVFNGIVADLAVKDRNTLALTLRDKLQRLNTPVTETLLGGTTENKDKLLPLSFGEVHNVIPLLTDPATLEYQVHAGTIEDIIEVRDSGMPIGITKSAATGKFTLDAAPAGDVTASVQGDKPSGVYSNTICKLIQRLATAYGKASDRFVADDLDAANLAAFEAAHPQVVGVYLDARENVLSVCQQLAASVGAQLVMSRLGKLRLMQIELPPTGTPTEIHPEQMVERSLHIAERTEVVAAVKVGFNKNWTVQAPILTTIPEAHKVLFGTEWLSETATDSAVQAKYKLWAEPVQEGTLLQVRTEAATEAGRRLDLFSAPHTLFELEGTSELLTLELGQAVTLFNSRYGLSSGKTGMVVALAPSWMTSRITVGVLI